MPRKKENGNYDSPSQNAFQMMMDARKISIGSNISGIENVEQVEDVEKEKNREEKKKRKLKLARWNSEKGGDEKNKAEERREKLVKLKLEKRAKHFKEIIQNGNKPLPNSKKDSHSNNNEKRKDQIIDNSDVITEKEEQYSKTDKFLKLLSPSIRKSQSVLSYFDRVGRSPESSEASSSFIKVKITPKSKKKHKIKNVSKKHIDKAPVNANISQCNTSNVNCVTEDSKESLNKTNAIDCKTKDSKESPAETNIVQSFRRSTRIAKKVVCTNEVSSGDDSEFAIFPQKKKIKTSNKLNSDLNECTNEKKKKSNTPINNKKTKNSSMKTKQDDDIILIENEYNVEDSSKEKLKLAPLFVKKVSIDPIVAEAKQKFLQSGVPLSIKKQFEKIVSTNCETDIFPLTVHIQQKTNSNFDVWNLPLNVITNLSILDNEEPYEIEPTTCIKLMQEYNNQNDEESWVNNLYKTPSSSVKECLLNIKSKYPKFPTNKMYKNLKQKFQQCTNHENVSDDLLSTPTWIEKYKPQLSCDIIGNFKSVQNIKKWLELWLEYCESKKNFAKNRRFSDDSLCDFYSSDTESQDSTKVPSKVIVVIGPTSSGKTSTIYAIANELNIEVLEANVSSKRSSKKINELGGLNSVNICKSGNNSLFQMSKPNSQELSTKKKMILMLIDDADLVFEEDDGFANALTNLIQSANRPMVLVASDHNCNHLQQFMKENNVFIFKTVSGELIGPWLDILLYVETGKLVPSLCHHLLNSNKGDIRSTILQLQVCINGSDKNQLVNDETLTNIDSMEIEEEIYSENESETKNSTFRTDDESFSIINKIYMQSNYATLSDEMYCKLNCCTKKILNKNNICELTNILENLSCLDLMQSYTKMSALNNNELLKMPWKSRIMDSLSLNGNNLQIRSTSLSLDLSEYMARCLKKEILNLGSNTETSHMEVNSLWNEKHKERQYFQAIYNEFYDAVNPSCLLNHRALTLDYLPTGRYIFETEQKRSTNSFKRNNRFHNYLSNLGIETKNIEKGYNYFGFHL